MTSIANKSDLAKFITGIVTPMGFARKKDCWYYRTDDCICVLALDKSPYGGQFYLEICFWLTYLNNEVEYPKFYKCHIRNRLDELIPDSEKIDQSLNLDDQTIAPQKRIENLENAIKNYGVPFLKSLSSLGSMREWLNKENARRWIILPEVREYFNIPYPE